MSYISNAIEELLVKNKLTAAGLSRASGMTEAQISRYRNGKQTWVSSEDLIRIARGFCPPPNADLMPEIHAFLLYACLRDVYVGPGADYISIALAADHAVPGLGEMTRPAMPILPPRDQQNLDVIAINIPKDRNIRDLTESVANFCRGGARTVQTSLRGRRRSIGAAP